MRSLQTMNAPEHSKRNRRLGLVLGLLFAGVFAIVTTVIVTRSKVPPAVEGAMESFKTPVLWFIGFFLVIVAIVEIVLRVVKGRVRENGNPE